MVRKNLSKLIEIDFEIAFFVLGLFLYYIGIVFYFIFVIIGSLVLVSSALLFLKTRSKPDYVGQEREVAPQIETKAKKR